MSDNDDLLGDDLGDQSLADYNLGNDEEEELLADDYDSGSSQNVPPSIGHGYVDQSDEPVVSSSYPVPNVVYDAQPEPYIPQTEAECVVPNITVEVPNAPVRKPTYAPYEPPLFEENSVVPPAIPAVPKESPQIVPSEAISGPVPAESSRRFPCERPAVRAPRRDIPDSLDKVLVPGQPRWRASHYNQRHLYKRNNVNRGNFHQRPSFPPPPRQTAPQLRPEQPRIEPPQAPPEIQHERPNFPPERPNFQQERPNFQPDRPNFQPERPSFQPERPIFQPDRPNFQPERPSFQPDRPSFQPDRPNFQPDRPNFQQDRPNFQQDRPNFPQERPNFRPERPHFAERPNFRPDMPNMQIQRPFNERPMFNQPRFGPNFGPNMRPTFPYRPQFGRPFQPPMREVVPNTNQVPQIIIRQPVPQMATQQGDPKLVPMSQEVRMLPVQLPPNLPPTGLVGKKVLINPHFKGNFQPPVEGLSYIPTRIQKSPPLSPTLENKFGPIKNIDDAAERFIAEQRTALAKAAGRKVAKRSPQRYIENTTIEIKNELAPRNRDEDELLRRQEEFISANREGLRRRMRPPSRSPSPPSPRRTRAASPDDEESEYRRRLREQENLRERVLRAKEMRRRRNARGRERDRAQEPSKDQTKDQPAKETELKDRSPQRPRSPDKTDHLTPPRSSPNKHEVKPNKPEAKPEKAEVTPKKAEVKPEKAEVEKSPERLTPPLPEVKKYKEPDSDDDLDLILSDIDGILSDDEDTGRFKEKSKRPESPKPKAPSADLRARLPPKTADVKRPKQRIIFSKDKEDRKGRDKTPPRKGQVSSSTNNENQEKTNVEKHKGGKKTETELSLAKRQRITFVNKEKAAEKPKLAEETKPFSNRRVVLQRKVTQQKNDKDKSVFTRIEVKNDPTKPNPTIFGRAVRTAIGSDKSRTQDARLEYVEEDDDDIDDQTVSSDGSMAVVKNLPYGMTDTRLKTLAGSEVQTMVLDKEERSAKVTFKNAAAANTFKRKFNNKMVAASRLSVELY